MKKLLQARVLLQKRRLKNRIQQVHESKIF